MNLKLSNLKRQLEELYRTYDRKYLDSDPLKFLYNYIEHQDVEIAGIISSALAYGNVKQIFTSIENILGIMGSSPYEFVLSFDPLKDNPRFRNFKHRFNDGKDISLLLYYLRQIYEQHRTLGGFYLAGYSSKDTNIESSLSKFIERILKLDCSPFYSIGGLPKNAGVRYFLSSPANKSACKRMNLFLRWMVRNEDDIDPGIWTEISPSQLILPLDTHTARICRYIGLTERKNTSWKMALEVTENLKLLAPDDPVKYDFAICRLGILDICEHEYRNGVCEKCQLYSMCSIGNRNKNELK